MHFQIVPTTLCNARCFYCYENDCMFETMQTSVVEATIDFIKKYIVDNPDDNYSIDWFGGEPMLVPELILYMANEILQYCKDRLVNINSEIVTNASKINAESIYFFESIFKEGWVSENNQHWSSKYRYKPCTYIYRWNAGGV